MSLVSLRLPEHLLTETDAHAHVLRIARTAYIRKAIEHMNAEMLALESRERLMRASLKVRGESMRVNAEFSQIEHDPKN